MLVPARLVGSESHFLTWLKMMKVEQPASLLGPASFRKECPAAECVDRCNDLQLHSSLSHDRLQVGTAGW